MEELGILKEQLINHLLNRIPKEYISSYQWWGQEEWLAAYNEKTGLAFDIEGWETATEDICIWKSRTTHAFNLKGMGNDFSDIYSFDATDLLDEFLEDVTDCFIAIDFQIPFENSKYFLQLQLPRTIVIDIGLYYLLEDLDEEFNQLLEPWCLVNNGAAWLFFEWGFQNIVFSNFAMPSIDCFEEVEIAQRQLTVECMDYLKTFLAPIYCPKSTYLSGAVAELQQTLRNKYISSFGEGFDTLEVGYFDLMTNLKELVNRYGDLCIGYTETLQSYLIKDWRGWQYALADPMSNHKEACNQYARWLEEEWFWNSAYDEM